MSGPLSFTPATDAELLMLAWLRSRPEIEALIEDRAYDAMPTASLATYPLVVLTRIPSPPKGFPPWLDHARCQVDCWDDIEDKGGSKYRATLVARAVEAALLGLRGPVSTTIGEYGPEISGVFSGIEETIGPWFLPDPGTARPRVLFEVIAHVHPSPSP